VSLSVTCEGCQNEIPQPAERCPHCGKPGIYWNVLAAEEPSEVSALDRRYANAKNDAASRKADGPLQDFESALAGSRAVIARSDRDVLRLATSTRQLYASYHELIEGGIRMPDGNEWDMLREMTDTVLFPKYKQNIKFGALSLDGIGLSNYGSCSIVLRDNMISHRTSVFEENSAIFMERHGVKISRNPNVPKGYRAVWGERAKLCVAKLAQRFDSGTVPGEYSRILLKQGATSSDEEFIESHTWGPITVLTMERVIVTESNPSKRSVIRRTIEAKLAAHNVPVN
jgi:hypothetical protein